MAFSFDVEFLLRKRTSGFSEYFRFKLKPVGNLVHPLYRIKSLELLSIAIKAANLAK